MEAKCTSRPPGAGELIMFWIVPVFSTGLQIVGATLSIAVIMINNTFFHYEHFIIFICSTNTSLVYYFVQRSGEVGPWK
jgi:hypothetical protein